MTSVKIGNGLLESNLRILKEVGYHIGFISLTNCGFKEVEKPLLYKKLGFCNIKL